MVCPWARYARKAVRRHAEHLCRAKGLGTGFLRIAGRPARVSTYLLPATYSGRPVGPRPELRPSLAQIRCFRYPYKRVHQVVLAV
jgi:hypothetical protein